MIAAFNEGRASLGLFGRRSLVSIVERRGGGVEAVGRQSQGREGEHEG